MLQREDLEYTEENVTSFLWKMHINGVLSLVSTIVAVWMIVFKSPKSMGVYKWFLLNITVFILWFELFIILLFTPFPIFPVPGFCAIGPIQAFGWYWGVTVPFFLLTVFLGICGMSVNLAAIFRLAAIYSVAEKVTKPKYLIPLVLSQMLYATPTLAAGLFAVDDIEKTVYNMLQLYPNLANFIHTHTCFAIPLDNNPRLYACLAIALLQLVFCEAISAVILYLSFKALIKRRKFMSKKLYSMHMQFILSLTVQFGIPIITINTPFLLYVLFLMIQSPAGVEFSQYMFVGVTTHSFFNTVIMISLTTPYRHAFLRIFGIDKDKHRRNSLIANRRISVKTITVHNIALSVM